MYMVDGIPYSVSPEKEEQFLKDNPTAKPLNVDKKIINEANDTITSLNNDIKTDSIRSRPSKYFSFPKSKEQLSKDTLLGTDSFGNEDKYLHTRSQLDLTARQEWRDYLNEKIFVDEYGPAILPTRSQLLNDPDLLKSLEYYINIDEVYKPFYDKKTEEYWDPREKDFSTSIYSLKFDPKAASLERRDPSTIGSLNLNFKYLDTKNIEDLNFMQVPYFSQKNNSIFQHEKLNLGIKYYKLSGKGFDKPWPFKKENNY